MKWAGGPEREPLPEVKYTGAYPTETVRGGEILVEWTSTMEAAQVAEAQALDVSLEQPRMTAEAQYPSDLKANVVYEEWVDVERYLHEWAYRQEVRAAGGISNT